MDVSEFTVSFYFHEMELDFNLWNLYLERFFIDCSVEVNRLE